jgi:thioredoxin 1
VVIQLIKFEGSACPACKQLDVTLKQLEDDYVINRISVETKLGEELAAMYGVMSLPTLLVMKDGEPVDRIVGNVSASKIRSKLSAL